MVDNQGIQEELNQNSFEKGNADLAYNYTAYKLNEFDKALDRMNFRLIASIGLNWFILGIATQLSDDRQILAVSEIIVLLCAVFNIACCLYGMRPMRIGQMIDPETFLKTNWFYESEAKCKVWIARNWYDSFDSYYNVYQHKAKLLQVSQVGLIITAIAIIINIGFD